MQVWKRVVGEGGQYCRYKYIVGACTSKEVNRLCVLLSSQGNDSIASNILYEKATQQRPIRVSYYLAEEMPQLKTFHIYFWFTQADSEQRKARLFAIRSINCIGPVCVQTPAICCSQSACNVANFSTPLAPGLGLTTPEHLLMVYFIHDLPKQRTISTKAL